MQLDVAALAPDMVFELAPRRVERVAQGSAHVLVVLAVGDDFAARRLEVDAYGELRALVPSTLDDHAAGHEALVEVLEVVGMLADDLVELLGVRNVAQRDLQGREHKSQGRITQIGLDSGRQRTTGAFALRSMLVVQLQPAQRSNSTSRLRTGQ